MRFVTKKTIERYLEKVPEVEGSGGWKPMHPKQAIPVFPRMPVLNPNGPAYLIYGEDEQELNKRIPSIDYFILCRRAAGDIRYQKA